MRSNYTLLFVLLATLLGLAVLGSLLVGAVRLPAGQVLRSLAGLPVDELVTQLVWNFRLPRVLTAAAVGAVLALAGLAMQTVLQNPLAGPDVLGVSAGASLGVALWLMAGGVLVGWLGSWGLVGAASLGAAVVLALLLGLAWRLRQPTTLLIIGLLIASAVSALVMLLQTLSPAALSKAYLVWSFGSMAGVSKAQLPLLLSISILGSSLIFLQAKGLNALQMGANYAITIGTRPQSLRLSLLAVVSILTGTVTAFCGPIGFIGIATPHLVQGLFRTQNQLLLLPATALAGAILLVVCDAAAQAPGSNYVLPINVITALVGAPVVVVVLLKGQRRGWLQP